MLTIKDIVELAKAGYKPAEVKELLELSKSEDNKEVPEDNKEAPEDKKEEPKEKKEVPEDKKEDEDKDIDYKSLYESTKKELDKAQKENRKKDISSDEDNKTDEDILKDLFKEFM